MGGTMRLGADPVKLHDGTPVRELYDEPVVYERHRHRYEVNNHLRRRLEAAGLVCSGTSPDERLVEVIELRRDAASVLRRLAVPPGVQVAPGAAGAAVPRVRRRGARAQRCPRPRRGRAGAPGDVPAHRPRREARHRRGARSGCTTRSRRCAGSRARPARARLRGLGRRELRGIGLERRRGRRRSRGRLRRRQPARPRIPGRRRDEHPALRPPGHRPAARADRAGARRRRLGERRTTGSSAPTTRRPSP